MKIGNIVSKEPIKIDKVFNLVESIDDCIDSIPTITIGLDYVRHLEPDFMYRKINDNLFWTFTKTESRKHHILDLNSFKDYCFKELIAKTTYIFIDPIQYSRKKIKKILTKVYSLENIITFVYEDKMVYLFSENLIFGIDLNLAKYMGIKDEKIKSRLKSLSTVFLEQNEILIEYKNYMESLDNQVKYIPLLYFMSNNE